MDDQETRMIRRNQPPVTNLPPVPGGGYDDDVPTQASLPPVPVSGGSSRFESEDMPTVQIPSSGQVIRPISITGGVDDQPTRFQRPPSVGGGSSEDLEKTRLVRPSSLSREQGKEDSPGQAGVEEPVVGWLVVTEGPGMGKSLCIGIGQNPIGRESDNRIVCNFGDKTISRHKHLSVSYDQRSRQFFVVPGDSSNMSYLNEQVILAPASLNAYDQIRLTESTALCFIPFCGERFSW